MAALLAPGPASAIETIKLKLPMLQDTFSVKVSELRNPDALMQGTSDLAELNRATNGEIGRKLNQLLGSELPVQMRSVVRNAVGSALLDQVLLLVSALGEVDGIDQQPAQGSAELEQALRDAARPPRWISTASSWRCSASSNNSAKPPLWWLPCPRPAWMVGSASPGRPNP